MESRRVSRVVISGRLQGFFALLPVARAQLVGLQCIEHAQDLFRAATDVQVGDVDEANDPLRIDDEGGALGDSFTRIEDAEAAGELALDVGEHGERQALQLLLRLAPGQVNELTVDAHSEDLRIARLELAIELAEGGDFRRTDEGEVFRPEEHDGPLAREAVVGEGLEGMVQIARDGALELEPRKLFTDPDHGVDAPRAGRADGPVVWGHDAARGLWMANQLIL